MTFRRLPHLDRRQRLGLAAAALLAVGAAGGAGAVSLTRPSVEMAPTVATPAAKLSSASGIVSVRGRVAEVYGDRFVVQDASGRALVDVGRHGAGDLRTGSPILVQGRYDDGQLRAHYLVDAAGAVQQVEPPHGGRDGHRGPPPPPPGGPGMAPPPPPPGAAGMAPPPPPPGGPGIAPPPPPGGPGVAPPPPPQGAGAPPPPVAGAPVPPVASQVPPPPPAYLGDQGLPPAAPRR